MIEGSQWAMIGGGSFNTIKSNATYATIAGGDDNLIETNAAHATISGGEGNSIQSNASSATIGGGYGNTILPNGFHATIPGGEQNSATNRSFAAGSRAKANHIGSFVWADWGGGSDFASTGPNQFLIRASGGMGINKANPATALDVNGTVTATAFAGSGAALTSLPRGHALDAADGLPLNALFVDNAGKVGIGTTSPALDLHVASASGSASALIGQHHQSGGYTALWMGVSTVTNGYAYLQGVRAAGSSYGDLALNSSGGNVGIGTSAPTQKLHVQGNIFATGTITPNSDRHAKTDIQTADTAAILDRVAALPIRQWRFKTEAEGVKHVGPMAQDFYGAFRLGETETAIATVDADGVALAAIQGLNQKLEAENAELKRRLERLEQLVQRLSK
jgi:hypothetical protein